jgi:sortase (surface protein transpeptidase)
MKFSRTVPAMFCLAFLGTTFSSSVKADAFDKKTEVGVAVLDSTGNEILTLLTCHPFYFVGAAPNRFIVRAQRVGG